MATVISIASPGDAVGRTTTAIALAAFYGSVGARVLLIDCDPNGDLTAAVRRVSGPTAQDLLADRATLAGLVSPSKLDHVDLLTAAGLGRQPPEALGNLLSGYGYVVADCGTRLDAVGTDILIHSQIVVIPLPAESGWEEELAQARAFVDEAWVLGARVVVLPTFVNASPAAEARAERMHEHYPHTVHWPGIPRDRELEVLLDVGDVEPRGTPGWHAYQQVAADLAAQRALTGI